MATKNIQVRLDENVKKKAEAVFASIGLDTPTAIRVFFMKVAQVGGIPFQLYQSDSYTSQEWKEIDQALEDAKKGVGLSPAFTSAEEMIAHLHSRK